jgi:hypothetical protein
MKSILATLTLFCLFTLKAIASGTSIGNGFAAESYLKVASLKSSKTTDKLCTDIKGAHVEKDVCVLKDGKIKLEDLVDAANKNDKKK